MGPLRVTTAGRHPGRERMSALLAAAAVILILLFVVLDAALASNGLAPTFEIIPDPAGALPF